MRTILSGLPTPVSLTYTATARSNPSNTYRGFTKQPFAHYHMWDVGETGTSVVQAFTVSRAGQETDRFRIIKVHMRGDTIWDRQLLYPARPLRNSDIKAWIDSVSGTTVKLKAATLVPNRKMLEDSLKRPKYWPPVVGIVHGIDGTIWLQQNAYGGGGLRFWMLSARGEYQATIEFPAGLRLLEASRTHAWGWMADADGLPEIVRYRVPQ